jgi:multidrug efflux pump subunit AcrA (membrane-fusion protein)
MHPFIIRDQPGNCPICGMKLVPVEETAKQPTAKSAVPGQGVINIEPAKQQLIGVVTTSVQRRSLDRIVRTVGRVTVDESRLSDVHTKVEGYIGKLYANKTGEIVRQGQPLLTIYSPDLVSTQQEYLVALRSRDRLAASPFPEVRKSGETLLSAARERLRLWDITDAEIRGLEESGQVRRTLTLYAPATGYIMDKMVVAGMRVMPEMALLRLADLSHIWVDAEIYEYESPTVRVGQSARLALEAHPGQVFSGRVSYIYPTVEEMTRTTKARLEFANPNLELKPGMYANVEIIAPVAEELAIPEQAVMDTGVRKVVFVKEGEGTFVPREVTLGPRSAGWYPVLSGLHEGEQVVSSPNFLLDSESRFAAPSQQMQKAPPAAGAPSPPRARLGGGAPAGHGM